MHKAAHATKIFFHRKMHCSLLLAYEKFSALRKKHKKSDAGYRKIPFHSNGLCFLTAIKDFLLYNSVAFYSSSILFTVSTMVSLYKNSEKCLNTLRLFYLLVYKIKKKTTWTDPFNKVKKTKFTLKARCTFTIKFGWRQKKNSII